MRRGCTPAPTARSPPPRLYSVVEATLAGYRYAAGYCDMNSLHIPATHLCSLCPSPRSPPPRLYSVPEDAFSSNYADEDSKAAEGAKAA